MSDRNSYRVAPPGILWTLLTAIIFGSGALGVVVAGLTISLPGTDVVTDPRELFATIGAALTGPLGGIIIGVFAGIREPVVVLPSLIAHVAGGLWMGLAYRGLVYERLRYRYRMLGWVALVMTYYYFVLVPGFTIGQAIMLPAGDIQPSGLLNFLQDTYTTLARGAAPEALLTTAITTLILVAIPRKYHRPLWGASSGPEHQLRNGGPRLVSEASTERRDRWGIARRLRPVRTTLAWRLAILLMLMSFLPIGVMVIFVRNTVAEALITMASQETLEQAKQLASEESLLADGHASQGLLATSSDKQRFAFIVGRDGHVLSLTPDTLPGDASAYPLAPSTITSLLTGGEGVTLEKDSGRVVGYAPIPGKDSIAIVVMEGSAVASSVQQMEQAIFVQLGGTLFLISIVGGAVIWLVMGPIRSLTRAAEQIGAGDFRIAIDPSEMEGELAVLADAFTRMAGQLRDLYDNLEQKVADRTRELRESEQRLRTVVTGAPIVLFATNRDGIFTLSEGSSLGTLGLKSGEVIGRSVFDVYHNVPQILDDVRRALSGEELTSCSEVGGLTFETRYSPIRETDGTIIGVIGVATDVTDRERAETAMKQAERKYRSIFENAVEGIYQSTPQGRILTANPAMARMIGYESPAELLAFTDIAHQLFVDPERRDEATRILNERGVISAFEFQVRRKNGQVIWVSENARAVRDADGAVLYYEGTIEEITERKQAEENLKQLAMLEERQRLARDLHDAVTQTLFSASLIGEVLPRLWERSQDEGRRRLEELRQLTRGALAEMRTLLLELRPGALMEMDMGTLLRQLTEAVSSRSRLGVDLTVQCERPLPPDVHVALYRIAQESLNNVTKHSGASQVTVSLLGSEDKVEMSICDNGRGFDPDAISAEHLGLDIMRERARAAGATMTIESQPGKGTRIAVVWPVSERER